MGEAKRKAAALATWEASLTPEEKLVADTARTLHTNFVLPLGMTGACYRLAFFLTAYLHQRHGIKVDPIVGYSNDGTGPIMASHAWIELNDKKTDISLTLTENREALPPGPLLILDRCFTKGDANYTYHLEQDAAAKGAEQELASDPRFKTLTEHKREEHLRMQGIAKDAEQIVRYLDAAPDGWTYEKIAALLDR